MVWFKSCKRCGGDLYLGEDFYGSFVSCLQCGDVAADFEQGASPGAIVEELEALAAQERSA